MTSATVLQRRPKDDSAAAIREAMDGLREEAAAAHRTIADETARRSSLLLTGTDKDIRASEATINDARLAIERIDLMVADLNDKLSEAAAREAGEATAQRVREATSAATAFNHWFSTEYAKLAQQLVAGLNLERQAISLRESLRDPISRTMGADLQTIELAHVGSTARPLGFLCRLPAATAGAEPFWWPR